MADSTLIASKIATQIRVLCASPAYLENAGIPTSLDDIASHRLIDKLHGADLLCWSSVIGHPARENTSQPMFGCDDFEAMRQAAVEGLGIAFLPDWVAGDDINSGALVQLFPEITSHLYVSTGIYALRALRNPPARVTVFLDALREFIGHPAKWSTRRCQL